ncbi:MAG TPA: hypothetical protein VFE21_05015 [Rubrobacteraceae bacterium]|nr:hypothetical protein [Rubrobacteraceae bacterium]
MTTPRGTHASPGDTSSATYHAERSHREAMQQELMDLGVWLTEHPRAAYKNLKPIRRPVPLEPGVYYNAGTGMVERLYSPQRPSLGGRFFRISSDPAAPVEEVRRKVMEGRRS